MSCSTNIPVTEIVEQIKDHLDFNYVDKDDPRITNGVFEAPTIRGGLALDEAAKAAFCDIVQECGLQAPFGKQWVNRPLYPNLRLISKASAVEGEVEAVWAPIPVITGESRPTDGVVIGDMYLDKTLTPAGKPIWWTGAVWVDATGTEV